MAKKKMTEGQRQLKRLKKPPSRGKKAESGNKNDAAKKTKGGRRKVARKPLSKRWSAFKRSIKRTLRIRWNSLKDWFLGRRGRAHVESSYLGKKFLGLLGVFLFYSLVFIAFIKGRASHFFGFLVLGDPYAFGSALVLMFLSLSLAFSVDKIRDSVFKSRSWYKQLLVFGGTLVISLYAANWALSRGINILPFLLVLSTFWLVIQSVNFFTMARGFSTRVEKNFVEKYSKLRLLSAAVLPWIILIALVLIAWAYRFYLVIGTLDLLSVVNPAGATTLYAFITTITMPSVYLTLVMSSLFIVLEFFVTRKRSETRSAGIFDNLTFALIVLFLFFYMLFQITLYMALNPRTVSIFQDLGTGGSNAALDVSSYLLFVEFGLSMFFLFRAVRGMTQRFGGKFLFFSRDGLVMALLACVMAQSVSRFVIFTGSETGYRGTDLFQFLLSSDRLIISIILIVFLGVTVLAYYFQPQRSSMFMRIDEEAVEGQDRMQELILKFLRREYIRKGTRFPVSDVEERLVQITKLPVGLVHSLLHRIADSYVDVQLEVVKKSDGTQEKYVDFIPVTERYDTEKGSEERAKKFLREKLSETLQAKKVQKSRISIGGRSKPSKETRAGSFITAMEATHRRAMQKERARTSSRKKVVEKVESLVKVTLKEDTLALLQEILRNEYFRRVKEPKRYSRVAFNLLSLLPEIEELTRLAPTEIFPLVDQLGTRDVNLVVKPFDKGRDRLIDFRPVTDFELSDALELYRPKKFQRFRFYLLRRALEAMKFSRERFTLKGGDQDEEEGEATIATRTLLSCLAKSFPERKRIRERKHKAPSTLWEAVEKIRKGKEADALKREQRKKEGTP
ncbi:MAG: hypothetical protein Kow0069_21150 [Promethearchaeota archaeon]